MDRDLEHHLVAQAKKDPAAFGQLFDTYYQPILRYLIRRTGQIELAQDLTGETFAKALKNLRQFEQRRYTFGAWLYAIATNELRQHYRRHKRIVLSLDYLLVEEGRDIADDRDLVEEYIVAQQTLDDHRAYCQIQQQIADLPTKYQEVISLRFFAEKKVSEIADILGKKEGTIKSLLSRGLTQLRVLQSTQPSAAPSIIPNEE